MATYLGTGAVFEVRSTATAGNLGGGGFNIANANFISDFTATGATGIAPVLSSASYNFVAGDVGAWIYVKSGTNWTPGWYQIASVAANAATLNTQIGQAIQISNNRFIRNTVAGIATVATPTSGTCGIDYSQQNAAQITNNVLTGTTTTCTDATTPFGLNHVGNFMAISAGTGVTAGWYEIVSVSGVTATLDRSAGASYSACTYYLGGAVSLGGSTTGITDLIFFALGAGATTSGCITFIKGGTNITYTQTAASPVFLSGNAKWPAINEGYVNFRGDRPTGITRPTLAMGTNNCTMGGNSIINNIIITGSNNSILNNGANTVLNNVKILNNSTTAGRNCFATNNAQTTCNACEFISYRGNAILLANTSSRLSGCYIHDSDVGILINGAQEPVINNCIISSNISQAINNIGTPITLMANISGNTLYGAESKKGIGINFSVTGSTFVNVQNNIIYGFTTGVFQQDVNTSGTDDYNNYFNNTNDVNAVANWQKGSHDTAINPSFTSVTQRTGATASTTAGNHLVQSGALFQTWGITAGVDCVYISAGTGVTAGIYGILSVDSETQITVDITLTANATADKVWSITQGHNFAIAIALKGTGYPGVFPAALTTGYLDIGAVQRQEPASGGSFTFGF